MLVFAHIITSYLFCAKINVSYMPTTYAHWRFGCDCIETLPEDLKKIIRDNRELYDIGVHGPDIFFYDLTHSNIPKYGSNMHHQPARGFFEECVKTYQENDSNKEAMLSFILGFLSHYALDSVCHGYINKKSRETANLSHNKIESEYDGHLMRLDGKAISRTNRAQSLKPDAFTSEIISRFFPFTAKEIRRTTSAQRLIISALNCKSNFKRNNLHKILNRLNKGDYADLIVQIKENGLCKDSNLRIDKLRAYALELYPKLADNICSAINNNQKLLPYFDRDFDPMGDDNSPVLSYEEELNYIPIKDID